MKYANRRVQLRNCLFINYIKGNLGTKNPQRRFKILFQKEERSAEYNLPYTSCIFRKRNK